MSQGEVEREYERVAEEVRRLIEVRDLAPGDRLPSERELAEMLGVSRIPVREAMRTLVAQGVVEIRHGQGTFVAGGRGVAHIAHALLDLRHTFEELFAVRRLLEPASAQWAATRAAPEDLARLRHRVRDMEAAAADLDWDALGAADTALHIEIAASARNQVLRRIMQAIEDLHQRQLEASARYRGRLDRALRDHRRIVAAIAAGDPVLAGAAMAEHLEHGEAATLAGMRELNVTEGVDGDG